MGQTYVIRELLVRVEARGPTGRRLLNYPDPDAYTRLYMERYGSATQTFLNREFTLEQLVQVLITIQKQLHETRIAALRKFRVAFIRQEALVVRLYDQPSVDGKVHGAQIAVVTERRVALLRLTTSLGYTRPARFICGRA